MSATRQIELLTQSSLERFRDRLSGWFCEKWDTELEEEFDFPDSTTMERGEWNRWVGETGERLSAKYLRMKGCRILYRNYRARGGGEVDIVCRDGNFLVFTEVKTRTSLDYGRPSQAVNEAKQKLIIRGANAWLRSLNFPEIAFRFDVVEVILQDRKKPDVTWIQDSFATPQVGLGQ